MATLHDTRSTESSPNVPCAPLALVAAVATNGVIGRDNALPWHLPADLRHFRAVTTGHAVIMGRRTWEAIGRPLPGRHNIVVTRRAPDYSAPGATVVSSLDAAIAVAEGLAPPCCIGGEEIFRLALPRATHMHLTEIHCVFDGDARFPAFEREAWQEIARESHAAGEHGPFSYDFVTLVRRGA